MSIDPVAQAREWALELPKGFARRLADAMRHGPDALEMLRPAVALPDSTAALRRALELTKAGHGAYLAGALTALLDTLAEQPDIEPVWTGPYADRPGGRLTLAVLADLLGEAKRTILLVSYATFPGSEIRFALAKAVKAGVALTLLLERHTDNPAFDGPDDPFPGLDALRLYWPHTARPAGAALHAKVLVVDDHTALVGSANLTGAGLERNLECGLLIRGGPIPAAIRDHLLTLQAIDSLQ